jgi:integrase
MATVKTLTEKHVLNAKAPESGQLDIWESSFPRGAQFGLRVSASGLKTWVLKYRVNGKQKREIIGTYPEMSLADARDKALEKRSQLRQGIDPNAEPEPEPEPAAPYTFGELWASYLRDHARVKKRSWKADEYMGKRDLLPAWEHTPVTDITRQQVYALVSKVAQRSDKGILGNRTLACIRKVFNWGLRVGLCESNPAARMPMPAEENVRSVTYSDEEIRALWKAFEAEGELTGGSFKLRLLTGQRGGEVLSMRWADLDFEKGVWTIPKEVVKSKRPHAVPLAPEVVEVLEKLRPITGDGPYVFASPDSASGHIVSVNKAKIRIRKAAKLPAWNPHDLRHIATTLMTGRCGVRRFVVAKVLNHAIPGITSVYDDHDYMPEKRIALNALAAKVTEIVTQQKPDNVIPLAKSAGKV